LKKKKRRKWCRAGTVAAGWRAEDVAKGLRAGGDRPWPSAHAGIEPQKGASAVQEPRIRSRVNALQDLARGSVNVVQVSGGSGPTLFQTKHARCGCPGADGCRAREVEATFRGLAPVDPRTTVERRGGVDPGSNAAGARLRAGASVARAGTRARRRGTGAAQINRCRDRRPNTRRPRRDRRRRARAARTCRGRAAPGPGGTHSRAHPDT
jgi:hypothetical protein